MNGAYWGAYGVRLDGSLIGPPLVRVDASWRAVEVVRRRGRAVATGNHLDATTARFSFHGGIGLEVSSTDGRAVFVAPEPISDAELVHPYLAPVGATFAWWAGREAFHAGAFAVEDRVWALVGAKGQGKSTMLAWLARDEIEVVCDDMLVVADGLALAGPRCVDLRELAAGHLGVGAPILRPPDQRWRVALGPTAPARPLAGWIFLTPGPRVETVPIPPRLLLPRLTANRSMFVPPRDPATLLDLSTLPAWELSLPHDWSMLPEAATRLLELGAVG